MKDAYIVVEHIYKKLRGREILHDMNLSVPSGAIVGLVGANGSGKSMLLRTIAGLIKPSKGKVWVDGKPLGKKHSFPDDLGIVIENVGLWPEYTGMENLALLAKIRGKIGKQEMEEALKRVGLSPSDSRIYKKYSLGMKQRLAIAQAIMERPKLLLLDEPTNDLDIVTLNVLEEYLQNFKGCVIVVSHDRYFMDKVVDHLLVFNGQGDIRELSRQLYTISRLERCESPSGKGERERSRQGSGGQDGEGASERKAAHVF